MRSGTPRSEGPPEVFTNSSHESATPLVAVRRGKARRQITRQPIALNCIFLLQTYPLNNKLSVPFRKNPYPLGRAASAQGMGEQPRIQQRRLPGSRLAVKEHATVHRNEISQTLGLQVSFQKNPPVQQPERQDAPIRLLRQRQPIGLDFHGGIFFPIISW